MKKYVILLWMLTAYAWCSPGVTTVTTGKYGIVTQPYFYLNSSALNNPYIQLK